MRIRRLIIAAAILTPQKNCFSLLSIENQKEKNYIGNCHKEFESNNVLDIVILLPDQWQRFCDSESG